MKITFILCFLLSSLNLWAQPKLKDYALTPTYMCSHDGSQVLCWGRNDAGQVQRLKFSNIQHIRTADDYACINDEIGFSCWGKYPDFPSDWFSANDISDFKLYRNNACILRQGSLECNNKLPGDMPLELDHISDFDLDHEVACAIQEGKIHCWGEPSFDREAYFSEIPQGSDWKKIVMSFNFACAMNLKSELKCWGKNPYGSETLHVPQNVGKVKDFSVGSTQACLINEEGKIFCWGKNTGYGYTPMPTNIKASTIQLNGESSCATDEKGKLLCWGYTQQIAQFPLMVKGYQSFVALDLGMAFHMKDEVLLTGFEGVSRIPTSNLTYMAGSGREFCLIDDHGPRCLYGPPDLTDVKQFSLDYLMNCALSHQGKVTCWRGRTVSDEEAFDPTPPSDLLDVVKIATSARNACALTIKNEIRCWGANAFPEPLRKEKIIDFTVGYIHRCIVYSDDQIECVLPLSGSSTPLQDILNAPTHLLGIKGITGNSYFACAYTDEEVACWGHSSMAENLAPKIQGKMKSISSGSYHACLEDDTGIKCWGDTTMGQMNFVIEGE